MIKYLSCMCMSLQALNSLYYPGAILEEESRSLLWPMATALSVLYFQRMKTPVKRLKCLSRGRLVMPNYVVLYWDNLLGLGRAGPHGPRPTLWYLLYLVPI
jgi:hypothetical protein